MVVLLTETIIVPILEELSQPVPFIDADPNFHPALAWHVTCFLFQAEEARDVSTVVQPDRPDD
jgi:hypothetical protein